MAFVVKFKEGFGRPFLPLGTYPDKPTALHHAQVFQQAHGACDILIEEVSGVTLDAKEHALTKQRIKNATGIDLLTDAEREMLRTVSTEGKKELVLDDQKDDEKGVVQS